MLLIFIVDRHLLEAGLDRAQSHSCESSFRLTCVDLLEADGYPRTYLLYWKGGGQRMRVIVNSRVAQGNRSL